MQYRLEGRLGEIGWHEGFISDLKISYGFIVLALVHCMLKVSNRSFPFNGIALVGVTFTCKSH